MFAFCFAVSNPARADPAPAVGILHALKPDVRQCPADAFRVCCLMAARPEKFLDQKVVKDHADKASGREQRIGAPEGAFANAAADVAGQRFVVPRHVSAKEAPRQAMILERREEQEASERTVLGVAAQEVFRNRRENLPVVLVRPEPLAKLGVPPCAPAHVVNDGPVEVFLVREVPEDDGFVHPSSLGDLTRSRSLKTLARKHAHGHPEDLGAADFRCYALAMITHCK